MVTRIVHHKYIVLILSLLLAVVFIPQLQNIEPVESVDYSKPRSQIRKFVQFVKKELADASTLSILDFFNNMNQHFYDEDR